MISTINASLLDSRVRGNERRETGISNEEGTAVKTTLLAFVASVALSSFGHAQDYPNRPIKMIVPISVGSITDVAARLTAQELEARLGQPVVVINKPGHDGIRSSATAVAPL